MKKAKIENSNICFLVIANKLSYIADFTSHWLQIDSGKSNWCSYLDLNDDSVINFIDFALLDGCSIEVIRE